jgi:predicted methyltransferase
MAAKQGDKVLTFERDMNVLHIASFNPFSQELFNNKKIEIYNKDIYEYIKNFESDFFNRIIHDPPTFKISPELYAQEFHAQLFRVLKKGGILYHYCPFPGKTRGNEFYKRILNQLSKAGFKNAEYHGYSSGIRAVKI